MIKVTKTIKVIHNKNEVFTNNGSKHIRELLDSSYQGVKKNVFSFLKLKTKTLKLMEEISMINQLMV